MKLLKNACIILILTTMLCACNNNNNEIENVVDTPFIPEEPVSEQIIESPPQEISQEIVEESTIDIIPDIFAYAITVSINPQVELYFDANDDVVGIAFLNEDAIDAYQKLDMLGENYEESMNMLIQSAADEGYLKENGTIDIELTEVGNDVKEYDELFTVELSNVANQIVIDKELQASITISVSDTVEQLTGIKVLEKCTTCNGTGNSCIECSGIGIVNCKRCNNGVETCGTCHGSATITCHGCHGSGSMGTGENTAACSYCGGSGIMRCDACGGQGTFLCSWCKGELQHVCPDCWGEGSCEDCLGKGYR